MRRPMWKIHCMTVLLLTGINIYLLIKLIHCAEKSNERNRTGDAAAAAAAENAMADDNSRAGPIGWHLERREHHRRQQMDVIVKGPWKSLQLAEESRHHQSHYQKEQKQNQRQQQQQQRQQQQNQHQRADGTADAPAGKSAWKVSQARGYAVADDKSAESDVLSGDLLSLGRWDDSRRFVVRDFALAGKQFHNTAVSHNVCLATQSSLDRLHWMGEAADHWRGAMSVAVYLDVEEVPIFHRVIRHMRRCHPDLLANVAFHIVSAAAQSVPTASASSSSSASSQFSSSSSTSSSSSLPISVFSGKSWTEATADDGDDNMGADGSSTGRGPWMNCTGPAESLTWLLKERPPLNAKWESGRSYPQNLMRNVARKGCPSHYVLLLDVDIVPSYNMAEALAEFLDQPSVALCTKCAFVVPTYELDYSADFPQNKSQLLALENQGRAQPFHQKAFRYNQYASNLTRWRQTSETDRTVVSHNVTNYEFFYEPFYIARDEAPPHDERFLGYGFTRNTQVYEMALSGWSFHVLSPVFTIHWGMQMKQRRPAWRKTQMDRNRRLFDVIHHELKAKYGLPNKGPVRWHAKPLGGSGRGGNSNNSGNDAKQQQQAEPHQPQQQPHSAKSAA